MSLLEPEDVHPLGCDCGCTCGQPAANLAHFGAWMAVGFLLVAGKLTGAVVWGLATSKEARRFVGL